MNITTFRLKFFVPQYRKISLGNTSVYQQISGIEKFYASERGEYHVSPSKSFLSHSTEKFRWGTLRCFRKFRVSQKFVHKKGISINSVEKFLSHSADKIRRRTLLCFERILVSKIFQQRKGKLHGFVNFFTSHRTEKTSPGNHSVFHKTSGWEKCFKDKRGGVSQFSVEKFLSDCTKIFRWRTLWCFRKILLSKIIMHRRGWHHCFVEIFCLTGRKGKSL